MASVLKVDKLDPQSGTALEIGTSGDTITVPSGATLDISSATLTPPATMPASSGINLTALNATNLGSGTVPTARLGTGTASSSTVLYGDQTYKAEPGGGIPASDQWSLTASVSGRVAPVTGWQQMTAPFGNIGSGMSESSGTWTFPSTGYWKVYWQCRGRCDTSDDNQIQFQIWSTADDSNYYQSSSGCTSSVLSGGLGDFGGSVTGIFDIEDVSTDKVQFRYHPNNTSTDYTLGTSLLYSSATIVLTFATFIKLADT